eukprot:TRINITY_DN10740_c0_g1_i11.p1 TRINITY_DN10740_c0_g1~~TRINITY_DN10740_c0_g1_i11.p1  ORF type:complete len:134 (+),score=50.02 TRINITY_DN10740_c0_g1_i11:73-474(+)
MCIRDRYMGISLKNEMAEVAERMQRIQDNEKVRWIAINDANKKNTKFLWNTRMEQSNISQTNVAKTPSGQAAILGPIVELACKARSAIRELDPINDLVFLRIRSTTNEYMIGTDKDFYLVVSQEAPKSEDSAK